MRWLLPAPPGGKYYPGQQLSQWGCEDISAPGVSRERDQSPTPACLCQVPRPLAMKKESIQTRKRKPKNVTAKAKGSSGASQGQPGHWEGAGPQPLRSPPAPLLGRIFSLWNPFECLTFHH